MLKSWILCQKLIILLMYKASLLRTWIFLPNFWNFGVYHITAKSLDFLSTSRKTLNYFDSLLNFWISCQYSGNNSITLQYLRHCYFSQKMSMTFYFSLKLMKERKQKNRKSHKKNNKSCTSKKWESNNRNK